MDTMIFVNLPVSDLERSMEFYAKLGFPNDHAFSDENGSSVVISKTIWLMLLTKPFFKTFTSNELAETTRTSAAIIGLSADSREAVDTLADKAFAAGAGKSQDPMDQGFMYSRSFADPDGHLFEIIWMDPAAAQVDPFRPLPIRPEPAQVDQRFGTFAAALRPQMGRNVDHLQPG